MTLNIRKALTTSALVATLLITGCASSPTTWHDNGVNLEGVESSTARINRLYLQPDNGAMLLRGEVTRRIHAHGQIPGHLHIEIVSPQGVVIKEADIGYSRQNSNTHDGSFELSIPETLANGSTIRVTHHDTASHLPEVGENPWRDPDNH